MVSAPQKRVNSRMKIMALFFGFWLIVVMTMLFKIGVFQRTEYLLIGNDIAVRQFFVHPQRGWILDRNRVVLAWSTTSVDLLVDSSVNENSLLRDDIASKISSILPEFSGNFVNMDASTGLLPVYYDLSSEQAEALKPLLEKYSELILSARVDRLVYGNPAVEKLIGSVVNNENILTGVSGIELKYDDTLTGTALIYEIMVDKYGKIIPSTYKLLQPEKKGGDVILPFSLEEIIKANTDGTE